jgi:hypothetical protein
MGDMPKRQKILLIILAGVVAVYLFQMIGGSDEPVVQEPQPISPGAQAPSERNPEQQATQTNASFGQRQAVNTQRTVAASSGQTEQPESLTDFELEWKSDPFYREKKVVAVAETSEGDLLKDLVYGGSSITAKVRIAFINGKLYKINDEVSGFKIIEIHSDHVVLEDKNNKRYTLR